MKFKKMHGLGNDFVILDHRERREVLPPVLIQAICDRHRGIGCDQLIVMEHKDKGPADGDVFMRIYNPDGSEAEACGNATRCVAHILMEETGEKTAIVETVLGPMECRMTGELEVEVDMGSPISIQDLEPNLVDVYEPILVNMGNPHCIIFVNDAREVPIEYLGPSIEKHDIFPDRTNVEFAHLQEDGSLRVRVWERGAGVTLACGSGACATAVAAAYRELTGRNVDVEMDGGRLKIEWREEDDHVLMTGPVTYVFEGEFKSA